MYTLHETNAMWSLLKTSVLSIHSNTCCSQIQPKQKACKTTLLAASLNYTNQVAAGGRVKALEKGRGRGAIAEEYSKP